MADFLAANNPCGQCLLRLVSRGNAIIAELLRLKDFVPSVFRLDTKQAQAKYADVIADFAYFKTSDQFEAKIDASPDLQDLDEELRENYSEVLTRFYHAMESVHKYITELNVFVDDLEEGLYIQQSLESVLLAEEGRQLLCESLYLYGVMLLVADTHIEGVLRERLLVSHHRYSARSSAESNVDDVCLLLRSTGYSASAGTRRPPNYPEEFFSRVPAREELVTLVLGRLRSDDVYNQVAALPRPEHRTVALATQAAMLAVCLFFRPATLHSQPAQMREIVDKFFPDNWVVSTYMGLPMNLVDVWEPYKAARSALANTVETANVRQITTTQSQKLQKLLTQTEQLLQEGVLTEDTLLDRVNKVCDVVRDCNVTLRWLMLHGSAGTALESGKKARALREAVASDKSHDPLRVFQLLLNTAQLELKIRDMFKVLLACKQERWERLRSECVERMTELSEAFAGAKPLSRVPRNDDLRAWFAETGTQIAALDCTQSHAAGRKIGQLIQALEEVQEFHQLESQLQVCQCLAETRKFLLQMIRTGNIKEDVLITLQIVADLSYAWRIIESYTTFMQRGIKQQPALTIKLRATFLKLASALEVPLLRINQAGSADLVSVSQYYSSELVAYVRQVLQVVPESLFALLARIVKLQTSVIKELPTRLDKEKLREFAQMDHRLEVAKLTHSVSVFTEGILMMKSTLVGIIRIDPQQLLEDGIRKELVKHIAIALHNGLVFNPKAKTSELESKLEALGEEMDGHRRSFEYIQDYVELCGLKIWQEEMSRIIGYNVEQECNSFLRNQVQDWQSVHQSTAIPIPRFAPVDTDSVNFVGRLARELIRITDPKVTVFLEAATAWYDVKTRTEVANLTTFAKMGRSVGTAGLTGLDRLLSFMIVTELQRLLARLQKGVLHDKGWLEMFAEASRGLTPSTGVVVQPTRFYAQFVGRAQKVWPQILEFVLKVGQMQLLRKQIAHQFNKTCRFQSEHLASALNNMNSALLAEVSSHYKDPARPFPSQASGLLPRVANLCDWAGVSNPFAKIYVTTKNLQYFALLAFLFVVAQIGKLHYVRSLSCLLSKRPTEHVCSVAFVVGVQTLFRQFHSEIRDTFLVHLGQYVRSHVDAATTGGKCTELPVEAVTALHFMDDFARFSGLPREVLLAHIPEPLLDQYQALSAEKTA